MSAPRSSADDEALGFNPTALFAKYQAEREKRLRSDGVEQYIHTAGGFSEYLADPYASEAITRDPIVRDLDVLVVGGGFGGLRIGAGLRSAGIGDFLIIEKASDFGGTWYWNRYPGVACDVESYVYMPLLEELGKIPSEKYATGREILQHSKDIGVAYRLYERALFQTQVTEMRWDEKCARWTIETDRGDRLRARFVCMSTGPLAQPKLPAVPGFDSFLGHSFHTSRWDYAYTGGNSEGGLLRLQDKRVGIIGTGATAVQCVPHLGRWAQQLYVFQRTPSSIDIRNNYPTDKEWAKTLQRGWQRKRIDSFTALLLGMPVEDEIRDGWTDAFRMLLVGAGMTPEERGKAMQMADFKKMEQIRARVDKIVKDPVTAEALKPYYNRFCKRPCFHDEYLETFNRPNVTLVDTDGKGIERITATGVVANGKEHEIDCLIYATGFEWMTESFKSRAGFEIYGRGGLSQSDAWEDGVTSLYGLHSRNFPNRFILGNSQQPYTANFTHMIEIVAEHVVFLMKHCLDTGIRMVEPTVEAEQDWVKQVVSAHELRSDFLHTCTPGYYNSEGKVSRKLAQNSNYTGSSLEFAQMLETQRSTKIFEGLELTR